MKKEKLSHHYAVIRESKILKFHEDHGSEFEQCISIGYSIGELKSKFKISYNLLRYYIKYYNLTDVVYHNNKIKLQKISRSNGKLSSNSLSGILLKPFSDEIINWYKASVATGMYKMDVMSLIKEKFGYGRKKYDQLVKLYGSPMINPHTGKLNSMYGKSPGHNSGIGIKSWIIYDGKKIFCRSLLELRILLFLIDSGIKFELSKHRILYKKNSTSRTYQPDITFIDSNIIAEIKPSKLVNYADNILKFNAAKNYCDKYGLKFNVITETTYDISKINLSYINNYINTKVVIIDDTQYERLMKNLK